MPTPFTVPVTVRVYETDSQGHLTSSAYLQYAEHARWELLRAAGIRQADLLAHGIGPVNLETTIRFHREVLAGDEVGVTCAFRWGDGKTFRVEQGLHTAGGDPVAEVLSVGGLLDLRERRLLPGPGGHFRALADRPELLGL
ncbi:acyl-CoA thioesterase [Jidongwangia harbinensis]|uniref:acyl-CoA thioesterase n=1 Tax=Jidongwangia harbinensis TaxID=2878561 RepID=UPI001CDA0389|nr:acyl-CoA thioesterase [Jidongwangia harbinensis]MCA2218267.1 acyl-CoA thioesterase [Jidongwangia harbinensis]